MERQEAQARVEEQDLQEHQGLPGLLEHRDPLVPLEPLDRQEHLGLLDQLELPEPVDQPDQLVQLI